MAREFTARMMEMTEEGSFDKDTLILELLNFLSEDEVKKFVRYCDFAGFEDLGFVSSSSEEDDDDYDDSMDGDHDSAMASAGWGTDEDYGYYGE